VPPPTARPGFLAAADHVPHGAGLLSQDCSVEGPGVAAPGFTASSTMNQV